LRNAPRHCRRGCPAQVNGSTAPLEFSTEINFAFTGHAQGRCMDSAALAGTLAGMQSALTAQQMSVVAVRQAHEMAQVAVNLLADAAQAGKALVAPGVGEALDRSA